MRGPRGMKSLSPAAPYAALVELRRAHLPVSSYRPPGVGRGHVLVQELSCVYAQNLMGPKLLIAVLVLTLSGANSDLASMCGAYCMSSASVHHYTESKPGPITISHHMHAHHKGAECAECPPKSGISLNQKSDCASLVQIEALKEGSFSLGTPSGVAQDLAETPTDGRALACHRE